MIKTLRSAQCIKMADMALRMNQKENHHKKKQESLACQRLIRVPHNSKGQLKIQEMAFVLLALVLLGFIAFMYFAKLQTENISSSAQKLNENVANSLRDKIAALPELKCSETLCIDRDKATILKSSKRDSLFQGLSKVSLLEIYPKQEEIIVYQSGRSVNKTYSTFINICGQKKSGSTFAYECGLGMLEVGI